jgi:uncharacterized protein (DUF2235 family)
VKRLLVFLDGTWNEPDDNTNVWRLRLLAADTDARGRAQEAYYEVGVGTKKFEKLRGGALGYGLNLNIRNAYQWLMSRYEEGDEIFLFGFSRGAYTARSLAGLINKCGLLLPGSSFSVPQIFERYERGSSASPLYDLMSEDHRPAKVTYEDRWLMEQSRRREIKFIGVWDTVGALGIPLGKLRQFAEDKLKEGPLRRLGASPYLFHSTTPSVLYKNMFQALAIDENREPFKATMWTFYQPNREPKKRLEAGQALEQRWFAGAHCNVGGGYRDDPVAQIPLVWLLNKASDAGLRLKRDLTLNGTEELAPTTDSFENSFGGAYRLRQLNRRYWRPIGRHPIRTDDGKDSWSVSVNETIDRSVFARWRADRQYRPKNLADWARRDGVDPSAVNGDWSIAPVTPEGYEPP